MIDAKKDNRMYEGQVLFIYLPGEVQNNLIVVEEGTGDNLLREDIESGYVDYVNWYSCRMSMSAEVPEEPEAEFMSGDGGMTLLRRYAREMTIGEIVSAVLAEGCWSYDAVEWFDAILLKGGASS